MPRTGSSCCPSRPEDAPADEPSEDPADEDPEAEDSADGVDAFAAQDDCGSLHKSALVHEAKVDRTGAGPVVVALELVR